MSKARIVPLLLIAIATSRCGCGATTGSIEGELRPFEGAGAGFVASKVQGQFPLSQTKLQDIARTVQTPRLKFTPLAEPIVPSEVIVRLEDGVPASRAAQLLAVGGLKHRVVTEVNGSLLVLRFEDDAKKPLSMERTLALIEDLKTRKGVKYVEANQRLQATAIPNDKLYASQWHYSLMNLPAAWDITQGSAAVTVAVLDTGIVPHPELDGRVVAGYDMISDPDTAGDGDGRDSNALDEGKDLPNGDSSWHGTHVAGTIGAATNNGTGVAGVDWNARLQPIRVLGRGGGSLGDITAAIIWAAGGTVTGVPANATPADVINMSLGGSGSPSQSYQEAIDFAVNRRTVVVVAAGNEDENTSNKTPCNQQSVICVGATRLNGSRASYSNFGTQVDVMAPGGETAEDRNGDGYQDGVLSTYLNASNQPNAQFLQGTSMASPHVAGLVALMKAVTGRAILPAQAEQFLKESAGAAYKCTEGCGAGMVNAQAAILRSQGATGGPAKLVVSTTDLYTSGSGRVGFTVTNVGGDPIASVQVATGGSTASALSIDGATSFPLAGLEMRRIDIDVSTTGLAAGTHTATVAVTGAGETLTVGIKIKVGGASSGASAIVAAMYQDENEEWQVGGGMNLSADNLTYKMEMEPREYFVLAAMDDNGNGEYFEDGERFGFWRSLENLETIAVTAGQTVSDIDIALAAFEDVTQDPLDPGAACTSADQCPTGFCADWPDGYCTRACDAEACPAGSTCTEFTNGFFCLAPCTSPGSQSTCRAGYVCDPDGTGGGICVPAG